jgi:hypothetical protein
VLRAMTPKSAVSYKFCYDEKSIWCTIFKF